MRRMGRSTANMAVSLQAEEIQRDLVVGVRVALQGHSRMLHPQQFRIMKTGIDWNGPHAHHASTVSVPNTPLPRQLSDEEVAILSL
ncbi:hypothetical protein ATANTOWER_018401 [Ataeniobius toweri]|uniref:Uncharacterized protein n=1 Tax=Ataeniobius toweri TaxID=208326 RepID=A0ABU7AG82_9TELE|nr:hypothetical protein [Ataeniobius toweri]